MAKKSLNLNDIVEPLDDMLFVRRLRMEKSAGGILMPDSDKDGKPRTRFAVRGEILCAGPGKLRDDGTRVPMQVEAGDVILFTSQAGIDMDDELRNEMKELGMDIEEVKKIILLRPPDILCRIKKR